MPKKQPAKNAAPAKTSREKPALPVASLDMRRAYAAETKTLRAVVRQRKGALDKVLAALDKKIAGLQREKKRAESATQKETAAMERRLAILEGRNS